MRRLLAAALLPAIAAAQDAPRLFTSSVVLRRMIDTAAATIAPDQPVLVQPVLVFGRRKANLEYRRAATGAAVHRDEDEMFWVIEGGGELVQGGALVGSKAVDAHNLSGTAITGGAASHVATGDVLVIPAGTPHWFDRVDGRLVMISTKVPKGQ